MSFFDLLHELRKGEPDPHKAVRTLTIMGWVCMALAAWNFASTFIVVLKENPFNFSKHYPYAILILMSANGALFILSAKGIREKKQWGVKTGQSATILFMLAIVGYAFSIFGVHDLFPNDDYFFRIFFIIFMLIIFGQLLIPAYLGIRYLERLSIKEIKLGGMRYAQGYQPNERNHEPVRIGGSRVLKYKEALLPFGVFGSFAFLMACVMVPLFVMQNYYGMESFSIIFIPGFMVIFFGPVVYNAIPSTFQKSRNVIVTFIGGGSIFMFNGSVPFFKLLVYKDGLEIRVMLHRFFIPYDKMEDIPEKSGFFSRGILIKSNLPGVPSSIRFAALGTKRAVERIRNARDEYLKNSAE